MQETEFDVRKYDAQAAMELAEIDALLAKSPARKLESRGSYKAPRARDYENKLLELRSFIVSVS